MLAALLKTLFARFGARYGYDTSYIAEMAELDSTGALKYALMSAFTEHRFGLAAAPYYAAKATAAQLTDCGSCLRLVIAMATEAGVAEAELAATLVRAEPAGERLQAPFDMMLAARYATAVIGNDPDLLEIIADCESRFGRRAVAGLAAATVSGMLYPTLKRGLGYGNACEPVLAELARLIEAGPIETGPIETGRATTGREEDSGRQLAAG